jgi:hypothetical protein
LHVPFFLPHSFAQSYTHTGNDIPPPGTPQARDLDARLTEMAKSNAHVLFALLTYLGFDPLCVYHTNLTSRRHRFPFDVTKICTGGSTAEALTAALPGIDFVHAGNFIPCMPRG